MAYSPMHLKTHALTIPNAASMAVRRSPQSCDFDVTSPAKHVMMSRSQNAAAASNGLTSQSHLSPYITCTPVFTASSPQPGATTGYPFVRDLAATLA